MPTRAEWRLAIQRRWPFLWRALITIALMVGIITLWQLYSLADYTELSRLLDLGATLQQQPWAVPFIIMLYVAAGIAFLPLTVMVVATILVYGPIGGFTLATAGTSATAIAGFGIGYLLGAEPLRRLAGSTLNRLNNKASQHGMMVVTALRIMPVAHFHAISLIAGVSKIRFGPYFAGTLLGTIPGIAAIAAVGNQAKQFLLDPNPIGLAVLAVLGALSLVALYCLRRWLRRYTE